MKTFAPLLLLALMIACSGCKREDTYLIPNSSYGLIYTKIFATSCAVSGCHLEAKKKKDLVGQLPYLEGEDAYSALINGTPQSSQATSAGLKWVIPDHPETSFLYQKVIYDSTAFPFGAKMPSGGLSLTANQIEFIRQWIVAGAPHDGHVADQSLLQ